MWLDMGIMLLLLLLVVHMLRGLFCCECHCLATPPHHLRVHAARLPVMSCKCYALQAGSRDQACTQYFVM
jgi:hypothetical protein